MKKTLLAVAAALAASVISSQAQVYSQNVVGYVNVTVYPGGYALLANPLNNGTSNRADYVFPNAASDPSQGGGYLDGSAILVYNGIKYNTYYFDSNTNDTTTGFTDFAGNPVAAPVLNPGVGFYFNNQSSSNSITIVGSVQGATSTGVSATNVVPTTPIFNLVGAVVPVGGSPSAIGLSNVAPDPSQGGGALDGSEIQVPRYTAGNGNIVGYTTYYFDSNTNDTTTGFTDFSGNPVAAPSVSVGQGFFISNQTGGSYPWIQTITF